MKTRRSLFPSCPLLHALWLGLCLAIAGTAGAATPRGVSLFPPEPGTFRYFGQGDAATVVKEVAVAGRPFSRALQIDTFAHMGPRTGFGLQARISGSVKQGDVLWISFWARSLESTRETGEAFFELRVDQLVDGKYQWPAYLSRGISVGRDWVETSVPFQVHKDVGPEDTRVVIQFDSYAQKFELGPVTFINCGGKVAMADLPRSVVRYGGDEPDADWRRAAAERIERGRKGDLTLKVQDVDGRPVAGAKVNVRMKRIAFDFGTAVTSARILDQTSDDGKKYREVLETYFNQVVFENEMKWPAWGAPDHSPARTLEALDWLDARGIPARGHVMVWPSWRHMPAFLQNLRNDPAALRQAVFDNIKKQTTTLRGRFAQWDVTNELTGHHDLLDVLGKDELVEWYRAAHAGEPDTKLFYNEYTMFFPDPGWEHFHRTVKFLKEKNAPLHGIAEQGHIGGTPPPIPLVLERLDRFAALGYPIIISEFDINSNDQDFQARYLRDFMTAVFSHPGVTGFVQWGFWEGQHWFPIAALWNKDWTLRKQGEVFAELVGKTWRTDFDGSTAADGTCATRAFYGDYEITITHAGKTHTQRVKLQPGSALPTITLR